MSKVDSQLAEAAGLHQAGRLTEAAELYSQIIARAPNHFDATHLLGVIALQEGRLDQAREMISAALRLKAKDIAALSNLGTVFLRQQRYDQALEQFERALKLQPGSFSALTNLGTVLRQLGRPHEALAPLRQAHSIDPTSAIVSNLLGACLLDTGDPRGAVNFFENATKIEPDDPGNWGNLATALNEIEEYERAAECAERAVALNPESSAAVAAMAAVQFEQGQMDEALATYRRAILLPDCSTQTHTAFANALWTSGLSDEAFVQFRQALALDGNNTFARWKLAMSNCRPFYESAAALERSRDSFAKGLEDLNAWLDVERRPEVFGAVGSTQPFFIAYQPFNNRELLSRYGRLCSRFMASAPFNSLKLQPKPAVNRKLRIGIVSSHIKNHSVWNAITRGWVQHLDKTRFELSLFHLGRTVDDETAWAKQCAAHFESGPKTLSGWVQAIGEARLDALIYPEIGMDSMTTQLASLRLASVQAATWGHPETTGLPTIDMYFSADGLEPIDAQLNYSEKLVRLPNLGVCVEQLTPAISVPDFKILGLPDDQPLLLCPGTTFKYSPVHDHIWARIAKGLQQAESKGKWARLVRGLRRGGYGKLVFFRAGNESMIRLFTERLRKAFDAEQVDFDASVCFIPYLDRTRWYGLMQKSTLMLDTVEFSGFNNALQAVEAGLPMLTREGRFMRGRLASSIMRRLDLPELIATTDESFIEMAVRLATDRDQLDRLRSLISGRRAILFNDTAPVRGLERCLIEEIDASQFRGHAS